MSLSRSYFAKVAPVVYEAFRNSSAWHRETVKPYSALSDALKRKIEIVVGRTYHDIVDVIITESDSDDA